jgi:hypothetical protein
VTKQKCDIATEFRTWIDQGRKHIFPENIPFRTKITSKIKSKAISVTGRGGS